MHFVALHLLFPIFPLPCLFPGTVMSLSRVVRGHRETREGCCGADIDGIKKEKKEESCKSSDVGGGVGVGGGV